MSLRSEERNHSSESDDDNDSLDEGGDLGLGFGLKPGAISKNECSNGESGSINNLGEHPKHRGSISSDPSDCVKTSPSQSPRRSNSWDKLKMLDTAGASANKKRFSFGRFKAKTVVMEHSESNKLSDSLKRSFSVTSDCARCGGDVPIGTSIRQQKLLFQQDKEDILSKSSVEVDLPKNDLPNLNLTNWNFSYQLDLEEKLVRAEQEVEMLRAELERCQKQLDAKYKAIQILQKQSQIAQGEHDMSSLKIRELTRGMQQEINKLQFELEYKQSMLMDSQQTWAQRFDRTCKENATLMSTLDERTLELKRLHAEKMAVCRERDELLALLDVQERLKYEKNRNSQSDEAYSEFSSNEVYLAVLGACNCRQTSPEPCGCAYAAANLRKETIKLREDIELHKGRREEAYTTVDAYRMAFEEQLHRNRSLTVKIAELTAPEKKFNKAKNVLRWLVRQLNEDLPYDQPVTTDDTDVTDNSNNVSDKNSNDLLKCQNEQEIIAYLLEKLNDKCEALAHQRLAARMLASRTKELEEKLHIADELSNGINSSDGKG